MNDEEAKLNRHLLFEAREFQKKQDINMAIIRLELEEETNKTNKVEIPK